MLFIQSTIGNEVVAATDYGWRFLPDREDWGLKYLIVLEKYENPDEI